MASIDHTARVHPLVRKEPKSKPTSKVDGPRPAWRAERERRQTYESRCAGAALAIAVMEGMLKSHRICKQMHNGERSGLLPLNPVQLIGLENAIDLLHHYVGTLKPGRGG